MKILITGSTGMVGKNLARFLRLNNSDVDVITPKREDADLLSYNQVYDLLAKHRPDCVIHCAGRVGGIQANLSDPVGFFVDNIEMGKNIVLASYKLNIKKLINLGSSCMYPKDAKNPLKESCLMTGELEPTNEGYALAKISVAKLCEYISKGQGHFQYKTIIPCNLYGPFDKFGELNSHMIPAVIRKIHFAKRRGEHCVEVWGDGTARREFMYVEDLAAFIGFSLQKIDELPYYLNVGTGKDFSIIDYYKTIAQAVGYEGEFQFNLDKPTGMKRKVVDVSNLRKFGWSSLTSVEEGVQITYQYFLENEVES